MPLSRDDTKLFDEIRKSKPIKTIEQGREKLFNAEATEVASKVEAPMTIANTATASVTPDSLNDAKEVAKKYTLSSAIQAQSSYKPDPKASAGLQKYIIEHQKRVDAKVDAQLKQTEEVLTRIGSKMS